MGQSLLSVDEALATILEHQMVAPTALEPIAKCSGKVLATDIIAPLPLPCFNSSAMDGYAVRLEDLEAASKDNPISLPVTQEIWAGKADLKELKSGEAARIMTGAEIPASANAVVMQEHVTAADGVAEFTNSAKSYQNIRHKGEEIKKGDLGLPKGHTLTPASLGFLASLGLNECPVYATPKIAVIATGSELIRPGGTLGPSQIFESNSVSLQTAILELGISCDVIGPLKDDKEILYKAMHKAIESYDHIIVCGGVSVGEYDYNKSVLADCQVKDVFWKVAQKPGKPFYFGTKGDKMVYGVPGNPASSLVCFYNYIRPALLKSMGHDANSLGLSEMTAHIDHDVQKKSGRTHFVRAKAYNKNGTLWVQALNKQGSHMMSAFADANCLVVYPKDVETISKGSPISIKWLPQAKKPGGHDVS